MGEKDDNKERLAELNDRNDQIERRLNQISRHTPTVIEQEEKDRLLIELNNIIAEIERLEARNPSYGR